MRGDIHNHRDPSAEGDDRGHDGKSNMAVQKAEEFGEKLPETDGAFVLGNEESGADIGFVDDGVLIDWDADRQNCVIAVKEEEAAPILVAVFDDGAFRPEIHGLQGLQRL